MVLIRFKVVVMFLFEDMADIVGSSFNVNQIDLGEKFSHITFSSMPFFVNIEFSNSLFLSYLS